MEAPAGKKHIVLVHGACRGGWVWYKVATRLRSAGHRVSTPDLAASGVDPRPLRDVPTFREYTKPLLDLLQSIPAGEKVVLVGHSFGGVSIALASEMFPEMVAAAVFVAAFMPDNISPPSYVVRKLVEGMPMGWIDTAFKPQPQDAEGISTFGPLNQLCSPEDQTLGRTLMREGSLFLDDLTLQKPYTKARYGSVRKVFIVCKDDLAMVEGFQRWMIQNYPVDEVKEIQGADHMAMLSTPAQLADRLVDVAARYA